MRRQLLTLIAVQRWKQIKDYEFIYIYLYIEALYTVHSMQKDGQKNNPGYRPGPFFAGWLW